MATNEQWTSSKEALETRGGNHIRVLEIDITDPDGYGPNTGWYTSSKTLYLTEERTQRNSSQVDTYYWPAVEEWGTLYQSEDFGSAFSTISDGQYVLKNIKLGPQETPTAVKAGTIPTPEPNPDQLRMSDLMRYYEWVGGAVRDKVISYENPETNQNSDPFQETTLFDGVISNVRMDRGKIVIDVIEVIHGPASVMPLTTITASPLDTSVRNQVVPVVYGAYGNEDNESPSYFPSKAPLVRLVEFARGDSGASYDITEAASDVLFAWNDAEGINTGWTTQPDVGLGGGDVGTVWRYIRDSDSFTQIIEGSSAGQIQWQDDTGGTGANKQLYIIAHKYMTGFSFIPCDFLAEDSGSALANPENMFDRDVSTYAVMDLATLNNEIRCHLPPVTSQGKPVIAADSVSAWLYLATTPTITGSPVVEIGLVHGTIAGGGSLGTHGQLSVVTSLSGIADQITLTAGTNPITLIQVSGKLTDLGKWYFSSESGTGSQSDIYVAVKVTTAGNANDFLHIIGAGLWIKHDVVRSPVGTKVIRVASGEGEPEDAIERATQITGPGGSSFWRVYDRQHEVVDSNLWATVSQSSLDDGSGTITGVADANIVSPPQIVAHAMLKWGEGVTASDFNFSTSAGSAGFGSIRNAKTDLDSWCDNVTGGSAQVYQHNLTIEAQTSIGSIAASALANCPCMIYRSATGTNYAIVYPNPQTAIPARLKFPDSDGTPVKFHPNIKGSGSSDYGKMYSFIDFKAELTPLEQIFNDFEIQYKLFAPTGSYVHRVFGSADGYSVYSKSTDTFVTTGDTLGARVDTRCTSSEARYGAKRKLPPILARNIAYGTTATALLDYYAHRYTFRRIVVEATAYTEAYDLNPGHVITISNDTNQLMTVPGYGIEDWEDDNFIVLERRYLPSPHGPMVWFRAEQLNPA